ncbi:MAG TPA: DUF6498-containing protein, partial [bacterium]
NPQNRTLSTTVLIVQSLTILFTNAIPLYGVLALGWNSFALVLLYILEGVIVFAADVVKTLCKKRNEKLKGSLLFEFGFIFFFGFFVLLVFGPPETGAFSFTGKVLLIRSLLDGDLKLPVLLVFAARFFRLVQDLAAGGVFGGSVKRRLELGGGGWTLLLFFTAMLAPFIALKSPNPTGGLAALVVVKTLGELIGIWIWRIVYGKSREVVEP